MLQGQQSARKAVERSTARLERPAVPDSLFAELVGTVQILPVEATLVLLEKPVVQLDAHRSHFRISTYLRRAFLEPRTKHVNKTKSPQSICQIFIFFYFFFQFSTSNTASLPLFSSHSQKRPTELVQHLWLDVRSCDLLRH